MNPQHDCSIELRKVQLAVTPARIAAMTLFEHNDTPLDSLFLVENLSKKGIDRVTAFRILNTFVEKGIIRKLEFGEGKARYELATKNDHHHLICEECDRVEDVDDMVVPSLEKKLSKQTGFFIKRHSLEFFGICKACQRKEKN